MGDGELGPKVFKDLYFEPNESVNAPSGLS